jgi:hypothetical protein
MIAGASGSSKKMTEELKLAVDAYNATLSPAPAPADQNTSPAK